MSIIVGYTTREHLLLDLDDTTKYKALGLIKHIMREWPEVGDALLLHSSTCTCKRWMYNPFYQQLKLTRRRENYHAVFNNKIGYEKCCQIIFTLTELDALDRQFLEIRSFRGDMTLRVSQKVLSDRTIPPPEPIALIHNGYTRSKGYNILRYLSFRQIALDAAHSSRPRKTRPWSRVWRSPAQCDPARSVLKRLLRRIHLRLYAHSSFSHLPG